MAAAGRFITVEGIDGAGKTTALHYLAERLRELGETVVVTREPGGTELAEHIRGLLKGTEGEAPTADTETLLMFAARAQHLTQVVYPALAHGEWVLCDRFTDATFAYQGGGRGLPEERIQALADWVHPGFGPHRTLLFDLPVAEGIRRRQQERGEEDRIEGAGEAFLERVLAAYRERAAAEPARFHRVDAGRSWAEVAAELDAWLAVERGRP
jgi:dTMP kinase